MNESQIEYWYTVSVNLREYAVLYMFFLVFGLIILGAIYVNHTVPTLKELKWEQGTENELRLQNSLYLQKALSVLLLFCNSFQLFLIIMAIYSALFLKTKEMMQFMFDENRVIFIFTLIFNAFIPVALLLIGLVYLNKVTKTIKHL